MYRPLSFSFSLSKCMDPSPSSPIEYSGLGFVGERAAEMGKIWSGPERIGWRRRWIVPRFPDPFELVQEFGTPNRPPTSTTVVVERESEGRSSTATPDAVLEFLLKLVIVSFLSRFHRRCRRFLMEIQLSSSLVFCSCPTTPLHVSRPLSRFAIRHSSRPSDCLRFLYPTERSFRSSTISSSFSAATFFIASTISTPPTEAFRRQGALALIVFFLFGLSHWFGLILIEVKMISGFFFEGYNSHFNEKLVADVSEGSHSIISPNWGRYLIDFRTPGLSLSPFFWLGGFLVSEAIGTAAPAFSRL